MWVIVLKAKIEKLVRELLRIGAGMGVFFIYVRVAGKNDV